MIAKLRGILDSIGEDWAILDVGGVGYLVACSARTLRSLGQPGDPVTLLIETHVREDAITLYGFMERAEQDWFRLLFTVQGVGAKVALGLLSTLSPDILGAALASGDKATLSRAPGVGPKLAARLATELKDKALTLGVFRVPPKTPPEGGSEVGGVFDPSGEGTGAQADAVSALVNLGYTRLDAFGAVARAFAEAGVDPTVNTLIQKALKNLGKESF